MSRVEMENDGPISRGSQSEFDTRIALKDVLQRILQVAQLWQRDRASSAILRGRVTLRLYFRLNGYVPGQYLFTVR